MWLPHGTLWRASAPPLAQAHTRRLTIARNPVIWHPGLNLGRVCAAYGLARRMKRKTRGGHDLPTIHRSTTARPTIWILSAVASLLFLVLVGGLAGRQVDSGPADDIPSGLWHLAQKPVVLSMVASLTFVWLAYVLRRILFCWRGAAPGPILVAPLEDATSRDALPVRDLGIQLQQQLSRVRLPAAEVPGGSPSVEFIQLMKQTDLDVKKPFSLFGGMLGLTVPSHAYEAKVTLLEGPISPSCGVALELVVLPGRLTSFHRYWEDTWERGIQRAAHGIAADVLPRTRQCDGPWTAWRWRRLPEELFDEYQQARHMLQERRFEEALGHYYGALRLDPSNRDIRLELGLAQQKLGLWLDALLTYHLVLTLPPNRGKRLRHNVPGRRIAEPAELLARYRFVSTLGFGEKLARQWVTTAKGGPHGAPSPRSHYVARDSERSALRAQLRGILSSRYAMLDDNALAAIGLAVADRGARMDRSLQIRNGLTKLLAEPTSGSGRRLEARRRQEGDLQLLFAVLAQHEARAFLRDTRFQRISRMSPQLSGTSLRISAACASRRRERAEGNPLVVTNRDPDMLARYVFGAKIARKLRRSKRYTDHYDAACAFAIPLLRVGRRAGRIQDQRDRAAVIACAVKHLHIAVDCADSRMMAARWDWIVSEDPDLAALRATTEFRAFEAARFPSAQRTPRRSTEVQQLELARHTAQLVSSVARRLEEEWHVREDRARALSEVDLKDIQEWWSDELGHWIALGRMTVDHRDWRTRLSWIERMQSVARRYGQQPFVIKHPVYAEDPIDVHRLSGGVGQLEDTAVRRVKASALRMKRLDELLTSVLAAQTASEGARTWLRSVAPPDGASGSVDIELLGRMCHACASRWAGLAMWFEQPVDSRESVDLAARDVMTAQHEFATRWADERLAVLNNTAL